MYRECLILTMRVDVHLVNDFIIEIHFFNYRGIFSLFISALHYPAGTGKIILLCIVLTRVKTCDIQIQLCRIGGPFSEDLPTRADE